VTKGVPIGRGAKARHLTVAELDALAVNCPPEILETYRSVRSKFRDHWSVLIPLPQEPREVTIPSETIIVVFDDGEVSLFESL
jgi:hypothetical protein